MHGQFTDAEVYLGSNELVGLVDEVNIAELEPIRLEHDTLGSIGVLSLPRRGLNVMNGSMVFDYPDPDMMAMTYHPNKAWEFQLHSPLDRFDSGGLNREASTKLITLITVIFTKAAFPVSKKDTDGKHKADFTTTKVLQRDARNETPIVEIDLMARIYNVMGEPVWPD